MRFDTAEHKEIALQLVKLVKFSGEQIDEIYGFIQAVRNADIGISGSAKAQKEDLQVPLKSVPEVLPATKPETAQATGAEVGNVPTTAEPKKPIRWSRKPRTSDPTPSTETVK